MKTITYNPETHRLVPVEPTVEMVDAITSATGAGYGVDYRTRKGWQNALSAAPQPEPVVIGSPLTERKAQSVIDRGYKITGYTLTNEQGQKCIVDMSAVRWFDDGDKFFRIMHPQPEPVEVEPVAYADSYGNVITKATKDFSRNVMTNSYSRALYTAPPDYEAVKKQRDDLQHTICEWEDANAKGGWIDELRQHARGELGRACEDRRQLLHALRNIAGMPCLSKEARAMSKFAIASLKAVRGVAADIPSDARGWEQAAAHYRGDDCYIDAALASVKGGAA